LKPFMLIFCVSGTRTRCPRPRRWSSRYIHLLWRLVQHHRCFVPFRQGQTDTHVHPILHGCRKPWKC
jgi:hypothetical protein